MYEAQINGKRIGDHYLTPGWTSYNKRLQYQIYDVTRSDDKRKQCDCNVTLGNGWYRGYLGMGRTIKIFMEKILPYYFNLILLIPMAQQNQLFLMNHGNHQQAVLRYAEIYNGETIDAREEKTGWSMRVIMMRDGMV